MSRWWSGQGCVCGWKGSTSGGGDPCCGSMLLPGAILLGGCDRYLPERLLVDMSTSLDGTLCSSCGASLLPGAACCSRCLVYQPRVDMYQDGVHQPEGANPITKNDGILIMRGRVGQKVVGAMDTTVKSSNGLGRLLSPSWNMVLGFKNWQASQAGTVSKWQVKPITWKQYTGRYHGILNRLDPSFIDYLVAFGRQHGQIVFQCYCPLTTEECHTVLLIDWLLEKYPNTFHANKQLALLK